MAYSGQNIVIQFQHPGSLIAITDAHINVSDSSRNNAIIVVPIPLMIYAFGFWLHEDFAASGTGSILLERQVVPETGQTTVCEMDFDATDLASGGVGTPGVTASGGSEAIDDGDVFYGKSSNFPYLITAPQTLTVSTTQTAVTGEVTAFIIARWLGIDYRSTEVWVS